MHAFMAQFFGDRDIADDTDIFSTGLVNSLFVMQLVLFVESEFGLTVEDEDLEMDNFRSVDAVGRSSRASAPWPSAGSTDSRRRETFDGPTRTAHRRPGGGPRGVRVLRPGARRPFADAWDRRSRLPEEFLARFAAAGYLGAAVPAEYGGRAWTR
ncbi:acyl-CoA dehydrogenase family protein [Streptomyces sp. M19]